LKSGDGHADKATAKWTSPRLKLRSIGRFQFIVRKDMHLKWPRAETPTHYITMGLNDDLNACATSRRARDDRFPRRPKNIFRATMLHALQRRRRPPHHRTRHGNQKAST